MEVLQLGADFWSWVLSDQGVDALRGGAEYLRISEALRRRACLQVRVGDNAYTFDDVDELFGALPGLLRADGHAEAARRVERFIDRVLVELATSELDGLWRRETDP